MTYDWIDGRAIAKALEIAERRLIAAGWKFSSADIGAEAREIINAFLREDVQ